MSTDLIRNSATSQNTHVYGRTLNSARNHHFVIDGTRDPKEEVTPVEVFLSAISACCVQWLEQFAREEDAPLERLDVAIEAARSVDEPNKFQAIQMRVTGCGVNQKQLEDFVNRFTERCPLYRTVNATVSIAFQIRASETEPTTGAGA